MRTQQATYQIKKGEKFGVFNVTDNFVESHHRSEKAALTRCATRKVRAPKGIQFEVVIICGQEER